MKRAGGGAHFDAPLRRPDGYGKSRDFRSAKGSNAGNEPTSNENVIENYFSHCHIVDLDRRFLDLRTERPADRDREE